MRFCRRHISGLQPAVCVRTSAIVVILVLTVAVPSASGASLRRLVASATTFASDGTRYVAWESQRDGLITVLDTLHGTRWTVQASSGCELESQAGDGIPEPVAADGRFLLDDCGSNGLQQALLDVRTKVSTPLPTGSYFSWSQVGDAYVEGETVSCAQVRKASGQCPALYNVSTGALSAHQPAVAVDLDRAGPRPVCSKLNRAAIEARLNGSFYAYRDGLAAHDSRNEHNVILERCNGSKKTLKDRGRPRDFDLRGGLLSWDTANGTEANPEEPGGKEERRSLFFAHLTSYNLRTRSRHTWALPRLSVSGGESEFPLPLSIWGYSTHTANTVFWIATRKLNGSVVRTSTVYAAPIR